MNSKRRGRWPIVLVLLSNASCGGRSQLGAPGDAGVAPDVLDVPDAAHPDTPATPLDCRQVTTPAVLSPLSGRFVQDTESIYLAPYRGSTIVRIPKHGGGATIVVSGLSQPTVVALAAGYVLWIEWTGNTLVRAAVADGLPAVVPNVAGSSWVPAVDGKLVYTMAGNEIFRISADDGSSTVLGTAFNPSYSVLHVGANVVLSVGRAVAIMPDSGGTLAPLANVWPATGQLVTDDATVFFATLGGYDGAMVTQQIAAVPVSGSDAGVPATIATAVEYYNSGYDPFVNVAVDDRYVYWTTGDENAPHPIQRVSKTGGPVQAITEPLRYAAGLLVDGDCLFWISPPGLMTMRKTP
jgi:hypothetical protein